MTWSRRAKLALTLMLAAASGSAQSNKSWLITTVPGGDGWIEVKAEKIDVTRAPYGAKGDGVTDDTASIQAALNAADTAGGGTVFCPKGSYKITATLVVNTSSTFKTINILGDGMLNTHLQWYGGTDQPAIRVNGLKQYLFEGFHVDNKVAKGTTVGILIKRDTGTGTQSGSAMWRNITIQGFATGVQAGYAAGTQATSELHLDNMQLQSDDIGFQIQDSNSLDFLFSMLGLSGNGTGIQVLNGGCVSVVGGSASNSTVADFDFQPAGSYTISTFRSEHANRFLIGGNTTAGTPITVFGSEVKATENADGYGVRVGSGPITFIGNTFQTKVATGGAVYQGSIAIGNAIANTEPVNFSVLGGSGASYTFLRNRQVDINNNDVGPFPDETGFIVSGVRVPAWKVPAAGVTQIGTFTTATRPTAATYPGATIYVSDGAGGCKFQGSDGSTWLCLG